MVPDATASTSSMDGPLCAYESQQAKQVHLDLLLLMDRSSSMLGAKWERAVTGLSAFIQDPASASLGVGLQFFPPGGMHPCDSAAECSPGMQCQEQHFCGSVTGGVERSVCDPAKPAVGCTPCVGDARCSRSFTVCNNLGAACPGGDPADMCEALGKTCESYVSNFCDASAYEPPAAPIAELPGGEPRLHELLLHQHPGGGTPMSGAVDGALDYLRAHLKANPDHRAALVLASDGSPDACMSQEYISQQVGLAFSGQPSILTFTIGLFASTDTVTREPFLNDLAKAGGTEKMFLASPDHDLSAELLMALSQIRSVVTLPCEYTLPMPTSGNIDYQKVNVTFQTGGGNQIIPYVRTKDGCSPTMGGWFYDVDPQGGGKPQRVIMCETSCGQLKKGTDGAKVELQFGCETVVIR
jgi:hypothetical protein